MVFQDPMTSLDPVFTIGSQMAEVLPPPPQARPQGRPRARAVELLDLVGIANPQQRVKQYPYEMSGGMRQRVLIAMALACEPELLVADEPTTALDVTIQAQILELLADLQQRLGLAVLLITHDLGVVAGVCDRVAVMYAGKIVEDRHRRRPLRRPGHPVHGRAAAISTPRLDVVLDRLVSIDGRAARSRAAARRVRVRGPLPAARVDPVPARRCRALEPHATTAAVASWPASRAAFERDAPTPRRSTSTAHDAVTRRRRAARPSRPSAAGRGRGDLTIRFPVGRAGFWGRQTQVRPRRRRRVVHDRTTARRSGSSARAARARPPSAARSCAASTRRRARSGSDGEDITHITRRASCASCAATCSSSSRTRTPASTRA